MALLFRAPESSFLPSLPPYHLSLPVLLLSLPFLGNPFLILTPAGREWVNSFLFKGFGSECSCFERLLVGPKVQFGVSELTIKGIGIWQCTAGVGTKPCTMLMTDLIQGQTTATEKQHIERKIHQFPQQKWRNYCRNVICSLLIRFNLLYYCDSPIVSSRSQGLV